jgi:hypothetical protein
MSILEHVVSALREDFPFEPESKGDFYFGRKGVNEDVEDYAFMGHKRWLIDGDLMEFEKYLSVVSFGDGLIVEFVDYIASGPSIPGVFTVGSVELADPKCFERLGELVFGHDLWDYVK